MSETKKIGLYINGTKYAITTQEDQSYVEELGRDLDQAVHQLMDGRYRSLPEALVLTSLSYADAYKKAIQSADHLRSQIAEYLEDAAKARQDADEARRELARLESMLEDEAGQKE